MRIDFKTLSMVSFCAFAVKCLILQNISAVNAGCLLISAAFVGFYEYIANAHQLKMQQSQIDEINKKLDKMELINKDIIGSISSVKTSINMKSSNNRATF